MDADTPLAERLKQIRHSRGMSLTDLAQVSGVSRGYLHLIERGDGNPSSEKLQLVANALGVPVSLLIGDILVVCGDEAMMISPNEYHLLQAIREQRYTTALRLLSDIIEAAG